MLRGLISLSWTITTLSSIRAASGGSVSRNDRIIDRFVKRQILERTKVTSARTFLVSPTNGLSHSPTADPVLIAHSRRLACFFCSSCFHSRLTSSAKSFRSAESVSTTLSNFSTTCSASGGSSPALAGSCSTRFKIDETFNLVMPKSHATSLLKKC